MIAVLVELPFWFKTGMGTDHFKISWIDSFAEDHRLIACVVRAEGMDEFILGSVYLLEGTGFQYYNHMVVASLMATADRVGLPYILAGDFNLPAGFDCSNRITSTMPRSDLGLGPAHMHHF